MINKIWLCDLTYTQQVLSSDVMPTAIAGIGTYVLKHLKPIPKIEIIKFPDNLIELIEKKEAPDLVGFSNYVWNKNLSYEFAKVIKLIFPNTIIVFGGPNYPIDIDLQEKFLRNHSSIDYHVVGEGEIAFLSLLEKINSKSNPKKTSELLSGTQYIDSNKRFIGHIPQPRIKDLSEIPSPYLENLLDKFFDGKMMPILQTNRGCPFTCTFCVEGTKYYNKVNRSNLNKLDKELEYISKKISLLIKTGGRNDLHVADSNFGMYKDDLEFASSVAKYQKKYNYPKFIIVATGKNQQQRILETVKKVNGAVKLTGAVQSLDPEVMSAIKRSNISSDEIMNLAKEGRGAGADSYGQLILALPNDSLAKHFFSLQQLVEADFNSIQVSQLMMLPGTESASLESRKKYKMITKSRVLPRCFGYYDVLEHKINVAEIEEICVANNTLSFDDYILCRKMNLIITWLFNDSVFRELLILFRIFNLPIWDFLLKLHSEVLSGTIKEIMDSFILSTKNELWDKESSLAKFTSDRENIKKYIAGEYGSNLLFKHKLLGITKGLSSLVDLVKKVSIDYLKNNGLNDDIHKDFVNQIITYNHNRVYDIFGDEKRVFKKQFNIDIPKLSTLKEFRNISINDFILDKPREMIFFYSRDQILDIQSAKKKYGKNDSSYSTILSKVYFRKFMRTVKFVEKGKKEFISLDKKTEIEGNATLTGISIN
jgi:radical SAM superfamily enzyme YgiQ (UPF0313 family)